MAIIGVALSVTLGAATAGAATLPDGRAYELISPTDKNGGDVSITSSRTQSAPSGDVVTYSSRIAFGDGQSSPVLSQYRAVRTSGKWTTEAMAPPLDADILNLFQQLGFYVGSSLDLSHSMFIQKSPRLDPSAPEGVPSLYARDNATGTWALLTPSVNPLPTFDPFYRPYVADTSDDFSHIAIETRYALTSDAPDDGTVKLYEWTNGTLRLAGVMPDGTPAPGGSAAGAGASILGFNVGRYGQDTMSADGSRLYFTAGPSDSGEGQIYLRENGTTTIYVSGSQRSAPDPSGTHPSLFQAASRDGLEAFFTSCEQLTDDATADGSAGTPCGPGSLNESDLYRFDVRTGALQDLSVDHEPADGSTADVQGVLGGSDDGSTVYFTSNGQIVAGAPTAPGVKLYVWRDGVVRYIATGLPDSNWSQLYGLTTKTSQVSADGGRVAFQSSTQLTSDDSAGTEQVYVYDADQNALTCVSCPHGRAATGDASVSSSDQAFPFPLPYQPRFLVPDGRRVFFNSPEALVPEDTNGVQDVYEWEDGAVHLISSGAGTRPSYFADASASGDDAYFVTPDRLVGWDRDDLMDLYDARVDGGLPEPPAPAAPCAGDVCQGPLGVALGTAVAPGSATFTGPGNEHAASFRVAPITARQRRAWVRTGKVTLAVAVSASGRISAQGSARLHGATRRVASASRVARHRGTLRLTLRLSVAARRQLARRGSLRVVVLVHYARVSGAKRTAVTLRTPSGASSEGGAR